MTKLRDYRNPEATAGGIMTSFEQAFSEVEAAAVATTNAATQLVSIAKQIRKAAKDGNISGMKKAEARLTESLSRLRQEVENASSSWPYKDEEEHSYLAEHFSEELRSTAKEMQLDIFERDGVLISYPSTVRILPNEGAVRVDRKKVSSIRPSRLVSELLANQQRGPRFRPQAFLDALFKAYNIISRPQDGGAMFSDGANAPVVPLESIYEVFTSMPGSTREYDRMDFARDIYFLDSGDVRATRSGAQVSFPISTATRAGRKIFSFVGPDGNLINYYGIQFNGGV